MLCSVFGKGGDDIIKIYRSLPYLFQPGNKYIIKREEASRPTSMLIRSDGGEISVLIIKSGDAEAFKDFDRACIISCGLSSRDSISVSSITDKIMTISTQRELPTVIGDTVCQQEFPVRCRKTTDPEKAAVGAGGLLCMGIKPQKLVEIVF